MSFLRRAIFRLNRANGSSGGAIYNSPNASVLLSSNGLFYKNTATVRQMKVGD